VVAAELIEIEDALNLVLEGVGPLGLEDVPLNEALGRILGADVESVDAVPAFVNSAMDGFALRAADTTGAAQMSVTLPIIDESRAGTPASSKLGSGEAIRIATGAMLPDGADSVVRVEDTSSEDSRVDVHVVVPEGNNVRHPGEDIAAGELVLRCGTPLGPAELGVVAAAGRALAPCTRRPRAVVLTTGDELQEPDEVLRPGGVRNANAFTVTALAERAGAQVVEVGTVRDDEVATREAIERALDADVLIVSGGVSVGIHDHVRPTLAQAGVEQVFWGVALRPGKPTWFGRHPGGTLVFGLPGNPVSAIAAFLLFARPAIKALQGADVAQERTTAIFDKDYEKRPGRAHLVRCRLDLLDDGWHVSPTKDQGSHVLTSMLGADAMAIVPIDAESVAAGDRVEIELLPSAWERWR